MNSAWQKLEIFDTNSKMHLNEKPHMTIPLIGTYQLQFKSPTPDDSGTYRCEFDQQGVEASKDVTIEIV